MSFALRRHETLDTGVKRVFDETTADALARLADPDPAEVETAVHETRKRCKEARGLVRLVRPSLGDSYTRTNRLLRDAARRLAEYRDAHALLATFDDLVASAPVGLPEPGVREIRRALATRAASATDRVTGAGSEDLAEARALVEAARVEPRDWSIPDDHDAAIAGLEKTYRRGRKRLAEAADDGDAHVFHQWRKRVKYTWYHLQLLEPAAPSILSPLADAFHDLSDSLGDAHDLAILEELVAGFDHVDDDERATFGMLAGDRRRELETRALALGSRLYVEKPKRFGARIGAYLAVWEERPPMAGGEIDDLYPVDDDLDGEPLRVLYERAKALDLAGRSTMDRDELEAAVRAAGG